ncbi:MAG: EAL domain-containing protein [Candidatus Paracaedibacteraceae bacterium]|jgi:EAL domain-containing protein (putative c-di-GMP-specific phosphodiesterase class I)|nr:EAL domain-containing protein [Candidatus Paracaedibacteraceae bacterium]
MQFKINAKDLRSALITNQLKVFLQPKVELNNYNVIGYEALLRWHHPRHGLISADQWIKVAEEHNIITPVTLWLLDECLKQISKKVQLSINVSVKSLTLDFAIRLMGIVKLYKFPPENLTIELTETQKIENYNSISGTLSYLRRQKIKVSLDDFGTGYNTLKTLAELEVDEIKIDTTLIQSDTPNSNFILGMIVSLAQEINVDVVCEGIETKDLLEKAKNLGVLRGQGYLFAKPCPIEVSTAHYNQVKKSA